MARISAQDVSIDFPIYHGARSIKKAILNHAVGGFIGYTNREQSCVHAISNLSFELKEGDRVGLIGHNGSGKTTLLRALAGIYEPARGRIIVDGKITSLIDCFIGFDSESSGYDNLFLRTAIMGYQRSVIEQKIDEIIEFSELGDFIYLPMRMYSSGMAARLVFAAVTSLESEVLLLDEWLNVGDANFVEKAQRRAIDMVNRSSIMVIATHNNDIIRRLCNKVLLLEHGAMKDFGETEEVLSRYLASV